MGKPLNPVLRYVMPMRALMMELSPLELEAHLDSLSGTSLRNGPESAAGNNITKQQILEVPEVLMKRDGRALTAAYNPEVSSRLTDKVADLGKKSAGNKALDDLLAQIKEQGEWVERAKIGIVLYLCEQQQSYLSSYNPFDLKPLSSAYAARECEYHPTTVSRLVRNLAVQLPDGKKIFAFELLPGRKTTSIKVNHALRLLSQNKAYFKDGEWQVGDAGLLPLVKDLSGCNIRRRQLATYTFMFERKYANS